MEDEWRFVCVVVGTTYTRTCGVLPYMGDSFTMHENERNNQHDNNVRFAIIQAFARPVHECRSYCLRAV